MRKAWRPRWHRLHSAHPDRGVCRAAQQRRDATERRLLKSIPPSAYAIDAHRVRKNFERAAQSYAVAARLEAEVGERMLERLDYVKLAPRRILDAGAGPGSHSTGLSRRYPHAQCIALDLSLPMLQAAEPRRIAGALSHALRDLLRGRLRGARPALQVCADLVRMPLASNACSLVWSNMALHWVGDVQAAVAEFHRVLEVDGLLMFSTLGPDTLKELRSALADAGAATHVHGFIDMHDLGDMLVAAGFAAPVMDTETITLTYSGVEGLIADLRATGQTCALTARSRGLMGPRKWQRAREYLQRHVREGRLPATIEVVYGHAWKAAARRNAEGHAIVQVDPAVRRRK